MESPAKVTVIKPGISVWEGALKGLFSESHQSFWLPSPPLRSTLCTQRRGSEDAFTGQPHLSPRSREAAAEKVGALNALAHLYWLHSSSTSHSLAVKLIWKKWVQWNSRTRLGMWEVILFYEISRQVNFTHSGSFSHACPYTYKPQVPRSVVCNREDKRLCQLRLHIFSVSLD